MEKFMDLIVWQSSHALVLQVDRLTKSFLSDERFACPHRGRGNRADASWIAHQGWQGLMKMALEPQPLTSKVRHFNFRLSTINFPQ
jgi:hypothetical protein